MKKYAILLLLFLLHAAPEAAPSPFTGDTGNGEAISGHNVWNGKKCAVVLTYDDGVYVHLDNAVPALDSLGFKGTFYVSCSAPRFMERKADWINASLNGHELGNHTLFHPCDSRLPGRQWVSPEYDLKEYTVRRIMDEIRVNNNFLYELDGKEKRTYAYTCGDMNAGETSYTSEVMKYFIAARGIKPAMNRISDVDLSDIDSFMVDGEEGSEMTAWVDQAMETGSLLVFTFHGVGGGHNINISLEAHRELLHHLKKHEDKIWVATLLDVSEYIVKSRTMIN